MALFHPLELAILSLSFQFQGPHINGEQTSQSTPYLMTHKPLYQVRARFDRIMQLLLNLIHESLYKRLSSFFSSVLKANEIERRSKYIVKSLCILFKQQLVLYLSECKQYLENLQQQLLLVQAGLKWLIRCWDHCRFIQVVHDQSWQPVLGMWLNRLTRFQTIV